MQIISKKVKDLIPYSKNAKKHEQKQIDGVAKSIEQFGFVQPVVVDKNNEIVIGHCRVLAAKKLGMKEVPCVCVDELTDEQVKALRLADNKLNESQWDFGLVDEELASITDIDMSELGFDVADIEIEEPTEIIEDEAPSVDEVESVCKPGDIWQLGEHRLMCGDSTKKEDVARLMNGQLADCVVTDPPYNVDYEGKTKEKLKIENDKKQSDEFLSFLTNAFERMNESLKAGGAFYIWFASREHINFETALNNVGLEVREELIWVKNSLVLSRQDYHWKHEPCLYGWKEGASHNWYNDRKQTTTMEFDRPTAAKEHPTMKPIALFDYQICNSSKKGEIVLDLFGGSGTTIMACEQNKRIGYVMEFSPKYCDVIIARWEKFTGKKAVKVC